MQNTINKLFITGISIAIGISVRASSLSEIQDAHRAFLTGNDQRMVSSIIDVYKNDSLTQPEKENINNLISKSFEIKNGSLSLNFQLPEDLLDLEIVTRAIKYDNIRNILEVRGATKYSGLIKNIELRKYPDVELLSKNSNSYEWHDKGGEFYLKNMNAGLVEDGLYRLIVVMKNGQTLDQWLPLIDLKMDGFPRLIQPTEDEVSLNKNPILRWQLFQPLKPLAYHTRVAVEAIKSEPPKYEWNKQWALYTHDLNRTKAVVGKEPRGEGVSRLEVGRYTINLLQSADRKYGPVGVSTQIGHRVTLFVR